MSYTRRHKINTRAKQSKVFGVPRLGVSISEAKPLRSMGLGVHRKQVNEFNEFYAENGISGAYHDLDGTCVLESRKARNQVLKLRNLRDNDASYGDWSGNH
jgi:hypothetical protein